MRFASAPSTDEARRVANVSSVCPPESIRITMAATQYSCRMSEVTMEMAASRSTLKFPRAISPINSTRMGRHDPRIPTSSNGSTAVGMCSPNFAIKAAVIAIEVKIRTAVCH